MKAPDTHQREPRRVDVPRRPAQDTSGEPARTERMPTQFVDPYDMSGEPPPEEPGYGHGV